MSRKSTDEETRDASGGRSGFGRTLLNVVRKALSASSISYLETLQETEPVQETVQSLKHPVVRDMADYDLDEAIRRSILDAARYVRDDKEPLEIEMERFRTRRVWEDEGSSSGSVTPSDGTSSRLQPSSSSGVTYEDLYSHSSGEYC